MKSEVVIFGGGIAGLWTLDALRRQGVDARLLSSTPLGAGQTIMSQGILHGGGKYLQDPWLLLHSPRLAVAALGLAREAGAMPGIWRDRLATDLNSATLRGGQCLLWLSKHGAGGKLAGLRWLDLAGRLGIITARPHRLERDAWPAVLGDTASAVYEMSEPVVDVESVVRALAEPHRDRIHSYAPGPDCAALAIARDAAGWRITGGGADVTARTVILAAGAGNQPLLSRAGIAGVRMQVRPLCMFLVRGPLPALHGHCSTLSPKPLFTVTTIEENGTVVWQIGGGISELHAKNPDDRAAIRDAAALLQRELPGLPHDRLEWAVYRADRAEPVTGHGAIPGSAYLDEPAPGLLLAWPVKLVLAPLLADRILDRIMPGYNQGVEPTAVPVPGFPGYARGPWEEAAWSSVS